MRRLIFILMVALLAGCGAQTPTTAPTTAPAATAQPTTGSAAPTAAAPDQGEMIVKQMQVDSVEVAILESSPPQVSVRVQGFLGGGCTKVKDTTQVRTGNTIEITITSEEPKEAMCTREARMYDEVIDLEGDFPPGAYIVRVNGVEKTFTI